MAASSHRQMPPLTRGNRTDPAMETFAASKIEDSIPARFERVVARHSDRLAVRAGSDTWTYDRLNRVSNQMARSLLARAAPGMPTVAILCGHRPPAIVALMGVLKAGKVAVLVDPEQPAERIETMLDDAEAGAVVVEDGYRERGEALANACGIPILNAETANPDEPADALGLPVAASDPALLLYTSGSTGRPKAVVHSHRSILHRIWLDTIVYGVTPEDRYSGLTIPSYGASLSEILGSLLNGASLHQFSLKHESLGSLVAWLAQTDITILRLAVSTFRALAPLLPEHDPLPKLRLIRLGGDTIYREDVALYQRHFAAPCRLCVALASTETNTICMRFIDQETPVDEPIAAVGWPAPDKEVLLLNEDGGPAAVGEVGEIAVRSRYLASGYWRRDDLTRARFLPDPADEGLVTFLTGDMGRWRDDGLLLHMGRKDAMVKIRGHRVELAEVEGFLQRVEGVRQAAVKIVPTVGGNQQLVGYVAPTPDVRLSVSGVRAEMSRLAPGYMVPSRLVVLPALPQTTTDKIDRLALPPPGAARPVLDTPFVAPRNELEQQIADIWAELLELDEVGVGDNFFDLGGDSLIALRMMLTVEGRYSCQVGTAFFSQPTVAHLAGLVSNMAGQATDQPLTATPSQPAPARKRPDRSAGERLRRLMQRGPLWRGYALSYGLGVRLQRAWLATPGIQARLFQREIQSLHRWGDLVGETNPGEAVRKSLLANTWMKWREQVLGKPLGASPWVTVTGDASLLALAPGEPGLILVFMHSALKHLFHACLQSEGREFVSILGGNAAKRTSLVYEANRILMEGGIVITAGDGRYGRSGITLPFYAGQLTFRPGPGELAVQTGARLAAVFTYMATDGHITFEVCTLAADSSSSHAAQVDALTRTYGEMVLERWPLMYTSQSSGHLQGMLKGQQSKHGQELPNSL